MNFILDVASRIQELVDSFDLRTFFSKELKVLITLGYCENKLINIYDLLAYYGQAQCKRKIN